MHGRKVSRKVYTLILNRVVADLVTSSSVFVLSILPRRSEGRVVKENIGRNQSGGDFPQGVLYKQPRGGRSIRGDDILHLSVPDETLRHCKASGGPSENNVCEISRREVGPNTVVMGIHPIINAL